MDTLNTTERRDPADPAANTERPEPQPWRSREEAREWRVLARGQGIPKGRPLARVVVDFDQEQTDWLSREADRVGLTLAAFLRKLVDDARARG